MASRKPILLLVLQSAATHFQVSPRFQYYLPLLLAPTPISACFPQPLPLHRSSFLFHTSYINNSTLNSHWHHSQNWALLATPTAQCNSRLFFVRLSGLLEEAPPSLRTHRLPKRKKKIWVSSVATEVGCKRKKGWWGEGLGRSTPPKEWCTLSRWTARKAISYCLATSGVGLT